MTGFGKHVSLRALMILVGTFLILLPQRANAQEVPFSAADTAWVLTSTALVLFMTLPGLALFYGGLVRSRNVLSLVMQCLSLTAVLSLIWVVCGYSLAFDSTGMSKGSVNLSSFIGGLSRFGLVSITPRNLEGFDSRNAVRKLSDDIRDHHTSFNDWGVCGTHAVLCGALVFVPVVIGRVRSDLPYDMGR